MNLYYQFPFFMLIKHWLERSELSVTLHSTKKLHGNIDNINVFTTDSCPNFYFYPNAIGAGYFTDRAVICKHIQVYWI